MTGARAPTRGGGVLLVSVDDPVGRSLQSALEAATIHVEWARSLGDLHSRAARDDVGMPELVFLDLELPDAAAEQLVPLARGYFPSAMMVALGARLTGEGAAQLLSQGIASLAKPISPLALTGLALQLRVRSPWSTRAEPPAAPPPGARLASLVDAYAAERVLSKQQHTILRLYLDGHNDKEIALRCGCSEATVYEHWRRMARKVGGMHKGDAIADFHRFLASA